MKGIQNYPQMLCYHKKDRKVKAGFLQGSGYQLVYLPDMDGKYIPNQVSHSQRQNN
jgi:hypothetical protein